MTKKVTSTFEPEEWKKYKNKWADKKEFKVVDDAWDRFKTMSTNRHSSCPWASPVSDKTQINDSDEWVEEGKGTGSDWSDHWDRMLKAAKMYKEYSQDRSNVKCPTSFAPIQALMAEFQENNIDVLMSETEDEDKTKVKLDYAIHKYWSSKTDILKYKATTFLETLELGTSIPFNGWQTLSREVEIILTGDETKKEIEYKLKENEEAKEDLKNRLYKEQRPLTRKETIYEYNDCIYVPTSLYEIYVDPDARYLRGPSYEATDIVWAQKPSLEQFRAEFRNSTDAFIIKDNIDRVMSAHDAESDYDGAKFFKAPRDITGNRVLLIRYYNKQTDKYIIIANDVLIRNGPLPYNHKQLPFSVHRCFEWKDQFYGFGLPAALESTQAVIETLTNLKIDQTKIDLAPPLLVNSDIFDDIDYSYEAVLTGQKIEVGGSVGQENIRWMDRQKNDFDYYRLREVFNEDSIMIAGVNPLAYSIPKPGEPVRTHIMSMESTLKMAKRIFKNWAEGWKESVRQFVKIREQLLPEAYIEQVDDETGETIKKYPTIKTEGFQLLTNEGGLNVEERKIEGSSMLSLGDVFNSNKKFLELTGDMDIQIDIDTLVPTSKAVKIELINRAFAQLIPVLANPQVLNSPGVNDLVREYIDETGLSKHLLEGLKDETSKQDIERAQQQEMQMKAGKPITGIPGESEGHKYVHMTTLLELSALQTEVLKNPANVSVEQAGALDLLVKQLATHLATDETAKTEATKLAVQQGMQSQQPQGMPGTQMPPEMAMAQMGGMPPQGAMPPVM